MYPKNAASPPRIAVGAVVQISDGVVQTSGVSIAVVPQGGASGAGGGTTSYDNGIVLYVPTQAETNYIAFVVTAYKTGCIPVAQTIVTTASAVSGHAGLDWATVNAPTTTVALTGTTIAATQKVDVETIKTQAVTAAAGVTFPTSVASPTNITAATGVVLSGVTHTGAVIPTVTTTTTATNLTNERGKYANGAVWIGPAANTNTVSYTDGIITNPVSTIAAAKTVADALGLRKFYTVRTGAIQIAATMTGYDFDGANWSLTTTGGSQDVGASYFHHATLAGGTFASTGGTIHWEECDFDVAVSVGVSHMTWCTFSNTLTLATAGDYDFVTCQSGVGGAGSPTFALGTGIFNISFRRWSGSITFSGITADDVITISGELGTVNLGSPSGAADIQIRGAYKAITNVGSAVVNLDGAILAADVAAILVDTAEIGAAGAGLSNINLPDQTMNITGNITGNLSGSVGSVTGAVGSVTGAVGSVTGAVGSVTGSVGSIAAGGIAAAAFAAGAINAAALATDAVDEIVDATWDEAIAGHLSAGSTGLALNSAGAAGDPWSTALPGAYGAGTAGKIVGDNINATISSRAAASDLATVAGYLDTEIAAILADTNEIQTDWVNGGRLDLLVDAIKAKTDSLTFTTANRVDSQVFGMEAGVVTAAAVATGAIDADALAADAGTELADAILARDIGSGTGAGTLDERTVRSSLRFIRNKWAVSAGVLTVKKEDDATTAWTAAVSTDAAADPVIGSDPT